MKIEIMLFLIGLVLCAGIAHAVEFTELSDSDKSSLDSMLAPVMKMFNMARYAASLIAAVVLLVAGISFMTAGSDSRKRDESKQTIAYIVLGLCVVWAAPMAVQYVLG